MKEPNLDRLYPVKTISHEDVPTSLRGQPTMQQFKVRFSSPMVAPHELPSFAYIPTQIGAQEIVFTAIIEASNIEQIKDMLTKAFETPTLIRIEVDCNRFEHDDMLQGATVRGVINSERKRGFFARIFF